MDAVSLNESLQAKSMLGLGVWSILSSEAILTCIS